MPTTVERIAALVREAITICSALDVDSLSDSTPLVEANMDSLTLVTVLSHVESTVGGALTADELVEVLRARDVGELAAAIARTLGAREANSHEPPENTRGTADYERF